MSPKVDFPQHRQKEQRSVPWSSQMLSCSYAFNVHNSRVPQLPLSHGTGTPLRSYGFFTQPLPTDWGHQTDTQPAPAAPGLSMQTLPHSCSLQDLSYSRKTVVLSWKLPRFCHSHYNPDECQDSAIVYWSRVTGKLGVFPRLNCL